MHDHWNSNNRLFSIVCGVFGTPCIWRNRPLSPHSISFFINFTQKNFSMHCCSLPRCSFLSSILSLINMFMQSWMSSIIVCEWEGFQKLLGKTPSAPFTSGARHWVSSVVVTSFVFPHRLLMIFKFYLYYHKIGCSWRHLKVI